MVDLPPVAGVQPRRQLIAYDTASQMPIAQAQGAGQLGPILQAVMQGGQAVAEGFSLPEMMAQYARATDPVASQNMSGLERLFATNPAINTMAGSLFGRLPQGAVLGSSALRRQGDNALPQVDEIVAYHGSPHDFDKFQMDKIGTGEGSQAFGYGLYYTDTEGISNFYKDMLKDSQVLHLDGKPLDSVFREDNQEKFFEYLAKKFPNATEDQTDDLYNVLDNLGQGLLSLRDADAMVEFSLTPAQRQIYQKIRDDLYVPEVPEGKTYKVALKTKLDNLVNYDTKLQEQPVAVQEAFRNIFKQHIVEDDPLIGELLEKGGALTDSEMQMMGLFENSSGAQAYRTFADKLKRSNEIKAGMSTDDIRSAIRDETKSGEMAMSALLNEEGISGIRFLDGSSRNTFGGKLLGIDEDNLGFRARVVLDDPVRQTGVGGSGRTITKSKPFKTKEEAQKWADNATKNPTNNYVIFDDKLVNILAKYGIVGGAGLAAANEFSSPAQADSYPNYMPPQAPELDANPLPTLPPNMV